MLEGLATRLELRVVWLGQTSPETLCGLIDVVVVPSQWPEPFGRVPIEIVKHGKPVLVSPTGGLVEASKIAGANSHLMEGPSVTEIARSLSDWARGGRKSTAVDTEPSKDYEVLSQRVLTILEKVDS